MRFWQKIKRMMLEWTKLLLIAGHSEQYRKALRMTKSDLKKLMDDRNVLTPIIVIEIDKEEFVILAGKIAPPNDYSADWQPCVVVRCITNPALNKTNRDGINFIDPRWHGKITETLKNTKVFSVK